MAKKARLVLEGGLIGGLVVLACYISGFAVHICTLSLLAVAVVLALTELRSR